MTLTPANVIIRSLIKCHYCRDLSYQIMLNNNNVSSSNEEKLLSIFLDSKLSFESDIGALSKKAG